MKVSELTGAALDWAVAKCEDETDVLFAYRQYGKLLVRQAGCHETHDSEWPYAPSTNWAQGGPIIEREKLAIAYEPSLMYGDEHRWKALDPMSDADAVYGPTLLISAMRCYVSSQLGDEIELPEGLV